MYNIYYILYLNNHTELVMLGGLGHQHTQFAHVQKPYIACFALNYDIFTLVQWNLDMLGQGVLSFIERFRLFGG